MIRVMPSVPVGCNVVGSIYWDDNPAVLGEDMLEVTLPSGILISCGWYPEGNPHGCYRVTASEGFDELRRVETVNVFEARSIVEQLAARFSGQAFFVSETESFGGDCAVVSAVSVGMTCRWRPFSRVQPCRVYELV